MDSDCNDGNSAKRPFSSEQIQWLISAVEHSIVPRLIQSANLHHPKHALTQAEALGAVTHFVDLILTNRGDQVVALIQGIEQRGASVEDIYLRILTPVARRLGILWEEDGADFTVVTTGMWRLHQIMHDLSAKFQRQVNGDHDASIHLKHEAILVPVPGSQHTFGALMLVEFFRREGWTVWGEPQVTVAEIAAAVKRKHIDFIGLSISTSDQLPTLRLLVEQIRLQSNNPKIHIMVGGPLILTNPHLVIEVGADVTASNAVDAVEIANKLMKANATRQPT